MRKVAILVGLISLVGLGCPDNEKPPEETPATRVGFIYVGPHTDYGWSKSHEDGRNYLEAYADNVVTEFAPFVTPDQAAAKTDAMIANGASIVFTTSFDFLPTAKAKAIEYPDAWMLNCAGFEIANHLGSYQIRLEQAEYLAGMVAGRMTTSKKIGVVGALKIYEQVMHINAFTLGVKSQKPDAQVYVRWIGDWFDASMFDPAPPNLDLEKKAVDDLVAAGVDVIHGLTDTNIPTTLASTKTATEGSVGGPVYSIGINNKDYCPAADPKCLTASYYDWGPVYLKLLNDIRNGTYPAAGRVDYPGLETMNVTGLAPFSALVAEKDSTLAADVEAKRQQMINGTFKVFDGTFNWTGGGSATIHDTWQELLCMKKFVVGASQLDGPTCATQADCGNDLVPGTSKLRLTCDLDRNLCVAADLTSTDPSCPF